VYIYIYIYNYIETKYNTQISTGIKLLYRPASARLATML